MYRINGESEHIHILTSIHPTVILAGLVKDIKVSTSAWNITERAFPRFRYWQEGYGGFTVSWKDRDGLIKYIKNQEEHHKRESFVDEYKRRLREAGLSFEDRYLL